MSDVTTAPPALNRQRFCNRPGSTLVPRLRRLFHSCPGTESDADAWYSQGKYCDRIRHWLQQPVSLLYEYLWHALHPWPCYGYCQRVESQPPRMSVWIVTGDGDSLSIGGNHTIHLLRRNFDVNILLFNNQIYGLTKGQYSPTSEENKVTKSTPFGSIDHPFNPLALAMGADASFIARTMDRDPKHLQAMLLRTNQHKGASFLRSTRTATFLMMALLKYLQKKAAKPGNIIP